MKMKQRRGAKSFSQTKTKVVREQPTKDSKSPRLNLDNERLSKFDKLFSRNDSNSINWYTKNKGLFEAATRITWATISGMTKPLSSSGKMGVPGTVMGINYVPNFVPNSPIVEQCWSGIYSEIVHANSRTTKYDQTDLAIICYAGMEIFAAIVHGVRAYGLMRDYTEDSLVKPQKFIQASHFDFNDLKKNYYRMWQDLEQLIVQSRQIWIPNVMPLVERRIWMNSYIYTDTQNDHSDYYMYVPGAFYKYNPTLTSVGGGLEKVLDWNAIGDSASSPQSNLQVSWDKYVQMVQSMIDALIPDQDRGIIYGDILKCYGKENLFALNQIDANYTTTVSYNPEVLWQIENSIAVDAFPVRLEQNDQVQLVQRWSCKESGSNADTFLPSFVMNFHVGGQPTNEMIAIATRMMVGKPTLTKCYSYNSVTQVYDETNKDCYYPSCSGTEIINSYVMYYNSYTGGDNNRLTSDFTVVTSHFKFKLNSTPEKITDLMYKLTRVAQLDWAPILYITYSNSNTGEDDSDILSELDNWSPVDVDVIQRVHNALLNSLLGVPTL